MWLYRRMGKKMLYMVAAGQDIYMANIDGSNPINLTQTPNQAEFRPAWSPDGQRISYERRDSLSPRMPAAPTFMLWTPTVRTQ